MLSKRFGLPVRITRHARERMRERSISKEELLELLECGEVRKKDAQRMWVYHEFTGRDDNLVCAAVVKEQVLVIKTVMIRWELVE